MQQNCKNNTLIANWSVIKVYLQNMKNKTLTELLATVKLLIMGAYVMKIFWSKNIKVMMMNQQTKNCALNQLQQKKVKILRQNYFVKLWRVFLTIKVKKRRESENAVFIKEIYIIIRIIISKLTINKVCWLHISKKRVKHQTAEQLKNTLIFSLFIQVMQHEIIWKNIVLKIQLYKTHLHNHSTLVCQCFWCDQWSHTQSVCEKTVKCIKCVDNYVTRSCSKEKTSCINCDQTHKS